jgi:predicted NAD-dependent protein-ADP-ribosyltransferase YbiA (DUF1768 family)
MHSCDIVVDRWTYPSVENAYQAAKCQWKDDKCLMVNASPSESKQLVKEVVCVDNFNRIGTMEALLYQKFGVDMSLAQMSMSHANLQVKLLNTGREIIIEGNTWHDNFWGNCTCSRCIHTPGANVLGSLLMHVREKVA